MNGLPQKAGMKPKAGPLVGSFVLLKISCSFYTNLNLYNLLGLFSNNFAPWSPNSFA